MHVDATHHQLLREQPPDPGPNQFQSNEYENPADTAIPRDASLSSMFSVGLSATTLRSTSTPQKQPLSHLLRKRFLLSNSKLSQKQTSPLPSAPPTPSLAPQSQSQLLLRFLAKQFHQLPADHSRSVSDVTSSHSSLPSPKPTPNPVFSSLRDSPSSTRTSVTTTASIADHETDDPILLKEQLRVSRSATKKLTTQLKNLLRALDSTRSTLTTAQRALLRERELFSLRERIAAEARERDADKNDLKVEALEEEMAGLRDEKRKLEDRVEDLLFRVCDGSCRNSGSPNKSKSPLKSSSFKHTTSSHLSASISVPLPAILPVSLPPPIASNSLSANPSPSSAPSSLCPSASSSPNIPSPVAPSPEPEEGYGSGENDDSLDPNHNTHHHPQPPSSPTLSEKTLASANETISSIGNEHTHPPSSSSTTPRASLTRRNSSTTPTASPSQLPHLLRTRSSSTPSYTIPEPLESPTDLEISFEPVQPFAVTAIARLTQVFQNGANGITAQIELDAVVAEWELHGRARVSDAECILVILESIVRVLETRVEKAAGSGVSVKTVVDKFFGKLSGYSHLISKYHPTHILVPLQSVTLADPTTKRNHRGALVLPHLMYLYSEDLVDVEEVLAWYALVGESGQEKVAKEECRAFVEWLREKEEESGLHGVGEVERLVDAGGNEDDDDGDEEDDEEGDDDEEEEEEEWDDDSDLLEEDERDGKVKFDMETVRVYESAGNE
ncbi:hypothetical protein HDU79_006166 [Rhizoclosmatium sp. JEL0117]|nr:hypothetical protein HDU79_006166 [Rhizoclosmatium sp. JEL0117]